MTGKIDNRIFFDSFQWNNKKITLARPAEVRLHSRPGGWIYECEKFGIHVYDYQRETAHDNLHEAFLNLADSPPATLTDEEKEYQRKLHEVIVEITIQDV